MKNKDKPNLETVTFRINQYMIDNVRLEADSRMISINDLINKIFKRFVEWNQFEPIVGMIHISRPVATELFNRKSNKDIIEMAKSIGKNAIYNTVLLARGKHDLKTFLLWIESEMNSHSLHVRHTDNDDKQKYIIKHDLGIKFSLYYKTIIKSIFEELSSNAINFTITNDIIIFEFESSNF